MKYIVSFELTTERYRERVDRFLATGALPPDGATMHGRWITLGHDMGFMLIESDNPATIFDWVSDWADLINFKVHPVLENDQAAAVLAMK